MVSVPVAGSQLAVTDVEISDAAAAGEGIELIDQDAMTLESMPLRARRVIVRLESAAVVFHSTNLRVRTRTSVRGGLVAYVVFGPRSNGTVNGLPVNTSWDYALGALAVSVLIGLAAGVVPAMRAARLNPVDALRAE